VTIAAAPSESSIDDSEFSCPICLDVLTLPVVLSCSHRFCFHCLALWSTQSQKCPVCRLEHPLHPDSYMVNSTLDEFLKANFPVRHKSTDEDELNESGHVNAIPKEVRDRPPTTVSRDYSKRKKTPLCRRRQANSILISRTRRNE